MKCRHCGYYDATFVSPVKHVWTCPECGHQYIVGLTNFTGNESTVGVYIGKNKTGREQFRSLDGTIFTAEDRGIDL